MCQQISIIRYLQRLRGNTQTDRHTHTHKPTTITLRLRARVNNLLLFMARRAIPMIAFHGVEFI